MACKILVVIDESKSSFKVIRYVAEIMKYEVKITLLGILHDAIGVFLNIAIQGEQESLLFN